MEQLTDKNLEVIISMTIQKQLPSVVVPSDVQFDDVRKTIRVYMRQHPEIFWFSHQYRLDEPTHTLYFKYNFTPQKKVFYAEEIEKAVKYLFQPNKLTHLSDLEKATYVYKWIANNTTYNEYSSFNQTIYSVLINRNSVCTGYAKTAQYLLGLIGVQSELVFGRFHTDKSEGGRHGWNIVKIDDNWYHVDFCLADPALKHLLNHNETPIEHDGLMWNYFCKPTEYILKNRSIEFVDSYPECVKFIDKRLTVNLAKAQKQAIVCKSDSGTSAKVYLDSLDKDSVIKKTRNNSSLIENEFKMLQRLKGCKNIVQAKGRTGDGIILERLTSWSELLNSHYYHPNESQLKDILIQLAEGLIECRDKGITYSDIHYNNVFVSKDGTYKWGDFGIAFPSTSDGHLPSQMFGVDGIALGSRWFMSPETYREGIFTESSAIYSLAMLAYFVMNDMRPPFLSRNISEEEALRAQLSGDAIQSPSHSDIYKSLSCLICSILNSDLAFRPKTFESFIYILTKCYPNFIPEEYDFLLSPIKGDENIFIIDNNSDGCVDDVHNVDLWPNDSDSFANTKGGMQPSESLSYNSDDFATTAAPSVNSNSRNDSPSHDTDSFARTCGFTIPARTAPECPPVPNKKRHSENTSKATDCATTFTPAKNHAKSHKKSNTNKSGIGAVIRSAINIFGGLFTGSVAGTVAGVPNLDDDIAESDDISTCLYAPSEILPDKSFIIRVYMYLPNEQDAIDCKVKEIDPTAIKKEYKPLDIPVKNGDKLTVQLDLSSGVECKNTTKTVIWRGHYTDCSFMAKLIDSCQKSIEGTAFVFVNDIPAGEMLFTIDVVDAKPRELYTNVESHRFSKIFISYAHQDESQVRGIAEGCRMLGKDYFFDRHSLQAGDIFKDKIFDYINNADLFVLCWSKNAAESEWVQIEREHALRLIREGKSSLSIYPLCLSPEAPLPLDMSDTYNFGVL